jgi:hypothetical protein
LREKQKSGPSVWAASSVTVEPASRQYTEDQNRRKPHPQPNSFPAESRLAAALHDDAGEDDETFFRARPRAQTRIRAAFPNEFPRKILKQGRGRPAIVVVAVERHPITLEPMTRARGVIFAEGGAA